MANTGYTSPFPTSHDTIGQSTLVTPLFMPSSPPQQPLSPLGTPDTAQTPATERVTEKSKQNSNHLSDDEDNHSVNELNHVSRPPTPGSPTGSDLDARLADYTLDFSNFPSGHFAIDGNEDTLPPFHKEADRLSDVGGPEDFTANMEKYLMGDLDDGEQDAEIDFGSVRRTFQKSKQPAIEEADSVEYSEFGPPVDMSTPSHLLHRPNTLPKDATHLEDIEEYPDDNEGPDSASPSVRKLSDASSHQPDEQQDLRQQVEQLQHALRERDDQLQKNRNRVLEAVSAGEQIRHLQIELERKNELLEQAQTKSSEDAMLREQIQSLQKENQDLQKLLDRSNSEKDLNPLLEQIHHMQQQLRDRDSQSGMDKERLETIAHLRQQLALSQEQAGKRDQTLEETFAKLKGVAQANDSKDTQLQQKNSEIDQLQGQIDDYGLENEKLEAELERAHNDFQVLEERFIDLETRNKPLEEKNSTLEASLTRVQSHMEAQESALKAAAADLPISGHSTYSEILDLIKDLGHGDPESAPQSPFLKDKFPDSQIMLQSPKPDPATAHQKELAILQQELQAALAAQKVSDAEVSRLQGEASGSQTLLKTIEAENSRLTNRVTELTAAFNKSQTDLTRSEEEHAESMDTIARLQEEKILEPPSQPRSQPIPNSESTSLLEANHQTQLRCLQTAHSTAVSTLRASHAESMRKIRHLLTSAEERESTLRDDLATLRSTSATAETQLKKSFKTELRRLEAVIAAKDETAAAVDQRIALSVDKREREWERRIDLLLKERDRMAKALMMSWGEKEMGRGPGLAEGKENRRSEKGGQAYRYKYATKKPKSDSKA
ncbi:unnamed protein product [Penicillium salamii]|nr:unnamed protein product [Penicillium salamii]CAG8411646.1 unnamed protein product [Penicillium salamii]